MDNSKSDIGLTFKNKILETGTSNLLFIKGKKFYSPKKIIMREILLNFLRPKLKNSKKDIFIDELKNYDEILLIGSGKGLASVKEIKK